MNRFASLRAQYADDVRKLTLLTEAASVFDQLSVTACPACLSALNAPPAVVDGRCSLCFHDIGAGTTADDDLDATTALVRSELRATKRRYDELTTYWQDLDAELAGLLAASEDADETESAAAAAVDRAANGLMTP